jgi:hypothetical protein
LLLSDWFAKSSYIIDTEWPKTLNRYQEEGIAFFPVVFGVFEGGLEVLPEGMTRFQAYWPTAADLYRSPLSNPEERLSYKDAKHDDVAKQRFLHLLAKQMNARFDGFMRFTPARKQKLLESPTSQQETTKNQQTIINNLVIYSLAEVIYRELLWNIGNKKEVKSDGTADQQRWLTLLFDHGLLQAKDWNNWIPFDEIPVGQNLSEIFEPTPAARYLMQLRGPPA